MCKTRFNDFDDFVLVGQRNWSGQLRKCLVTKFAIDLYLVAEISKFWVFQIFVTNLYYDNATLYFWTHCPHGAKLTTQGGCRCTLGERTPRHNDEGTRWGESQFATLLKIGPTPTILPTFLITLHIYSMHQPHTTRKPTKHGGDEWCAEEGAIPPYAVRGMCTLNTNDIHGSSVMHDIDDSVLTNYCHTYTLKSLYDNN